MNRCTLALAAVAMLLPNQAEGQTASAGLHFTLRGWAEDTWLLLEDRDAATDGRLGRAGLQHRFHDRIDAEYELDLISTPFGPTDEYAWYQQPNGVRYWGGSINRRELIDEADFRVAVPLGQHWSSKVQFNKKNSPTLSRSLVRVGFKRQWNSGVFGFIEGSLHEIKPSSDVAVVAGWQREGVEATVGVSVLDAFNGVVHQLLRSQPGVEPTALVHERQPIAFRSTLETNVMPRVRVEAHAAILLPTRIRAYQQAQPDSGFRQAEAFGMIGGLVEWQVLPNLTIGTLGTYVRSVLDRNPLPGGDPADDFRLVERTMRAGIVLLARPSRVWLIESWVRRTWRTEERIVEQVADAGVDWEDRSWSSQWTVSYRPPGGFTTGMGFEMDLRDVVRAFPRPTILEPDFDGRLVGIGPVPSFEFLGRHESRTRFEVGWRFTPGNTLLLGFRIDVDTDRYVGRNSIFDGAHARFRFAW